MDRSYTGAALVVCAMAWSGVAAADAGEGGEKTPRFVTFTLDNDLFAGGDSHYTDGLQLAFVVDRTSLPGWMNDSPPVRWSADPAVMLAVGQRMYTPTNTHTAHPDPNDRPYAGWLYFLMDVMTRNDSAVDHATFSLGVIGPPSLVKQAQQDIHHLVHSGMSEGWDSQLGTEPALMLGYERAWPGLVRAESGHWDVTPRAGATIGNVLTYANAGFVARWGRNLPSDAPVTHISLGPPRDGYRGTTATGWYAWVGADVRAVARNIFLDGNTWKDGPSVDRKPFGCDIEAGFAITWPRGRLGFTYVRRSDEFRTQQHPDRFGQLTLSLPY